MSGYGGRAVCEEFAVSVLLGGGVITQLPVSSTMRSLRASIVVERRGMHLTSLSSVCAGLVFMAFGFNLVDCGGLLGQRLGKNIDYAAMRSLKKAKSAAL